MMTKIPKRETMSNQRNDFITHPLIKIIRIILSYFVQMEKSFIHIIHLQPDKEREKQGFKLISVNPFGRATPRP
jgi:hypothetical protein